MEFLKTMGKTIDCMSVQLCGLYLKKGCYVTYKTVKKDRKFSFWKSDYTSNNYLTGFLKSI